MTYSGRVKLPHIYHYMSIMSSATIRHPLLMDDI